MPPFKPIDRACTQAAYAACVGRDINDEIYITRDGRMFNGFELETIDPSKAELDALIVMLAQAMKLHIAGLDFAEILADLLEVGAGVKAADLVHDHLRGISLTEWAAINARIGWYADDMASTNDTSSGRIR